jgi:beta-N-acetylhexosaminidase
MVFATTQATAATPATPLAKLAGQSIMTGFTGTHPDASLLARIREGAVGGILLLGDNVRSPAQVQDLVRALQATAAAGGNPPLLIAVDQEGGAVKRLPEGPPDLSPAALGRLGSSAKAHAEGEATGRYLHAVGIDVDLAPVVDSPDSPESFLGTRAYSGDPRLNGTLGAAFAEGVQGSHVAGTAKHFPGLGTARANTDANHVLVTSSRAILDARLFAFSTAVARGVKLVMVSNAGYSAYDASDVPAVLSRPIVTGLLRQKLGFDGVVISDDMLAPGPSGRANAAVRALSAGVDIVLYSGESASAAGYAELLRAPRSELLQANAHIAGLKRWLAAG